MVENLQKYTSYRECIKDFYNDKRASKQGFSYRLFSYRAGFKSPNFIQLVIQGKRNLSLDGAANLAKAMKFSKAETEYFCALVAFEHSEGPEAKQEAQKTLLRAVRRMISKEIPKGQSEVLSEWQHLVVRELVNLKDFKSDPKWISKKLRGLVSPEDAETSLELLLRGGFLKKNAKGRLEASDPVIDTGDWFSPAKVLNMHQKTLKIWIKALESMTIAERQLGVLNIPIAKEKIPQLKAKIMAFEDEIIGWLQDEKNPDQVVQLGTYLIPISS